MHVTVTYTNLTELTNLSAFIIYVINVSAVSSGGLGPWNTIKVRTNDAGTNILMGYSPIKPVVIVLFSAQSYRLFIYKIVTVLFYSLHQLQLEHLTSSSYISPAQQA